MNHAPAPGLYPSLAHDSLPDVLRLIRSEHIGPVTLYQLIRRYGTAAKALEAIPHLARNGGAKRSPVIAGKDAVAKEIAATERYGAHFIKYGDDDYPFLLRQIPDAPPVLSVFGSAEAWKERKTIALVGARNASANGCQFAYKLAMELGKQSYTIVSGLARGVDTAAHKGALATGTVAVIAGGIDHIYPPENAALYQSIRDKGGAIVSELPFGASPQARNFPARNRIISGMSVGTAVIEASHKSGSLITARFANEQGREVFAVPGSPLDPRCHGTNDLIRQGAVLTESAEDILRELKYGRTTFSAAAPEGDEYCAAPPHYPEEEMENARALIHEKLGFEPVLVDELIVQCQVPPGMVLTILLELELAGNLSRHPGGKVSLLFADSKEICM